MPLNNWRSYAPAGGAIALLLAIIALGNWAGSFDSGQRDGQGNQSASQQPNSTKAAPRKRGVDAAKYQPNCDEPKSREEADVCAQLRMAQTAADQARFTYYGLWLLGLTLAATAWAAMGAARSASVAESALKDVERAFVFIKLFETHVIGRELNLLPQWENTGSTPASPMRSYVSWSTFNGEPGPDFRFPDLDAAGNPLPGSGNSIETFIAPKGASYAERLRISVDVLEQCRRGEVRLFAWGHADYRDVFGADHVTTFCNEIVVEGVSVADDGEVTAALNFPKFRRHNTAR